MLLTEIIKFSDEELIFLKYWKSCKWIYWEKYPSSIFLVKDINCHTSHNGKIINFKEKQCVFEINWKNKKFILNNYSSNLENFLRFNLRIDVFEDKLAVLILNLLDDLLNQSYLKPKNKKMIEKVLKIEKNKKIRKVKEKFEVEIVLADQKFNELELLINKGEF